MQITAQHNSDICRGKAQTHILSNLEAAVLHQQKNMPNFTPVNYCKNKTVKLE